MGICGAKETDNRKELQTEHKPNSPARTAAPQPSYGQPAPKGSTGGIIVDQSNFIREKSGKITDFYEVLSPPLGAGAFGEVRKARYKASNDLRAVKIINKANQSKDEQERLINEVDILRKLDHPHIIKVYEFYQDDKYFYIVTELCTGGELFDKIVESKNFTEKKAAQIAQQVLSAIAYCHQNRIVHRDLKPENLLLDSNKPDSLIKVIDFGLSRVFDPSKKMRHKLGTVYYIAPEVLQCQYDEKCDVWSLGVITYIMLCGYPPFNGSSDDIIIQKIQRGEFSFSAKVWNGVSEQAKNFIKKTLTFNPALRYTAQNALDDEWLRNIDRLELSNMNQPLVNDVFTSLKTFRADQKLAQATYIFIVSYLTTKDEKEDLMRTFKAFDKNNDGYLSKDELVEGYTKFYGAKNAEEFAAGIMKGIDTNQSGKIDYSEFVVAAMNKQAMMSKDRLEAAFKAFDADGNGFITVEELKQLLQDKGHTPNEDGWRQIIQEVDANGDGKISFKEFKEMMVKTIT